MDMENLFKSSVDSLNAIYKLLEEENKLDEQATLNWLDQINEISVRR